MNTFATHKQTIAKIYTDEAKILDINIAQLKNVVQHLREEYSKNPKDEYLQREKNYSTEIENDQRRLDTCMAISNWLLGTTIKNENED
jgi:hypothetical protein